MAVLISTYQTCYILVPHFVSVPLVPVPNSHCLDMSPPHAVSPWNLALVAGTAALATLAIRTAWNDSVGPIASPHASQHESGQLGQLPYPPDALPGARDVDSPYGPTRVYEWGPHDGPKVLLIHGISTPSIALADLAHRLVARGFRVLLFGTLYGGFAANPQSVRKSTRLRLHEPWSPWVHVYRLVT